ncbi:ATP-binding protein [Clostridiaceae bacterium M8S5]|nr:ATP-binding protein [Clostridiaceae bacterium M8S5]
MKEITTLKKIIIVSAIATLMGQVYINPFNSSFRICIGVAVLMFLLLWFEKLSIIKTTIITSAMIYSFRTILDILKYGMVRDLLLNHLPAIAFYITMGFIFNKVNIRRYKRQPILLIFLLGITDVISNIVEILVRNEVHINMVEAILNRLLITGFGRALLTLFLYMMVRSFNTLTIKEEHQKRYKELLLFTANMKAEVFFLQKNSQLIEQVMGESYSIYQQLKDYNCTKDTLDCHKVNELRQKALNLSKDIHEIKKDNKRVVLGIEKLLPNEKTNNSMSLSAIFEIISDNTKRFIQQLNKEISLEFIINENINIKDYYAIITIINNLINNSIGAIDSRGFIKVTQTVNGDNVIFEVLDNGCGIPKKNICAIFEPGFSTKFDRKTGNMSTGIGLTHVRNIAMNKFGGDIKVKRRDKGTSFYVYIPIDRI